MELRSYINSYVHVELNNGFYYTGKVISADDDFLEILDKFGKKVSVAKSSIMSLKEVRN